MISEVVVVVVYDIIPKIDLLGPTSPSTQNARIFSLPRATASFVQHVCGFPICIGFPVFSHFGGKIDARFTPPKTTRTITTETHDESARLATYYRFPTIGDLEWQNLNYYKTTHACCSAQAPRSKLASRRYHGYGPKVRDLGRSVGRGNNSFSIWLSFTTLSFHWCIFSRGAQGCQSYWLSCVYGTDSFRWLLFQGNVSIDALSSSSQRISKQDDQNSRLLKNYIIFLSHWLKLLEFVKKVF